MNYNEYQPHADLQPYIEAYWTVEIGDAVNACTHRILPDGCMDLIFNRGTALYSASREKIMTSGGTYLVGTMTTFLDSVRLSGTSTLGIRFKPGGFAAFSPVQQDELRDQAVPYQDKRLSDILSQSTNLLDDLNLYFLRQLPQRPAVLTAIVADITSRKGQISVAALLDKFAMSERKLERLFKHQVGVSPKGLISLTRFVHATALIRNTDKPLSLTQIAYQAGYYDQSHLCNEIKRYSGLTASQL